MQANLFGEQDYRNLTNNKECLWLNEPLPQLDAIITEQLRIKHPENYQYKIYLGCWCSDSKKLIPSFEAIKKEFQIPDKQLRYFSLDIDKKSPGKTEEADGIEYIPTIIILKNGKEIGRIIEIADPNLETVLLGLL